MMGEVGGRCGKDSHQHPHEGACPRISKEGLVPAHIGMRADDDRELGDGVDHIDRSKTQKYQCRGKPNAGHEQVIEKGVSIHDPHRHVIGRVMGAVKAVQKGRGVGQGEVQDARLRVQEVQDEERKALHVQFSSQLE